MAGSRLDEVGPPKDTLVRRRWIKPQNVEWTEYCCKIAREYGWVESKRVYDTRVAARHHARKLIRWAGELELCERWELIEHVNRKDDGYIWAVEYVGGRRNGSKPRQSAQSADR